MQSQKKLIHNTDWHILILLDACRYDYFEKCILYDFEDNGILIPVRSEGATTATWLLNTWTDYYPDITYISGNAFINSKDVEIAKFNGNKHFGKVVDTWDYGFDKKTGRVEASEINKDAYIHIKDGNGRYILHYQQPHAPYLFEEDDTTGGFKEKIHTNQYGMLRKFASIFIPIKVQWKVVCLSPFLRRMFVSKDRYTRMYKKYGKKKIREAYERNLLSVLVEVKKVVERYPNMNILITADHAERLGEHGQFGHGGKTDSFITTVPFYFIDRRK